LLIPDQETEKAVVFVHGGGVTREEGGFFTRLAAGLGEAGVASLRYDLRGYGESEGRQEDSPLSVHLNDIRVAIAELRERTEARQMSLLAASFTGGLAAYYAAKRPEELARLVLINPLLDYKERFVDQKPYWHDDCLDDGHAQRLADDGFLVYPPGFKLGRAMLNESTGSSRSPAQSMASRSTMTRSTSIRGPRSGRRSPSERWPTGSPIPLWPRVHAPWPAAVPSRRRGRGRLVG
jgi:hypothetical protein